MHTNAFPGKAKGRCFCWCDTRAYSKREWVQMEENLEISKSKFFLSLSLSPKRKRNAETLSFPSLSLFTFEVFSLSSKEGAFWAHEQREREREGMICAKRFVSLFKKCFSLLLDFWKSDEFFILNSRLKKKREKKFRINSKLSHETNTTVNEEAQNTFLLLTRAALTTNTILLLTL